MKLMKCRIVDNEFLQSMNEKIDKLNKIYGEFNEAYKKYNEFFEKFIKALNERNEELRRQNELANTYKEAYENAKKQWDKQQKEKKHKDTLELECWVCHKNMKKQEKGYRCVDCKTTKNKKTKKLEDTGCVTKIYDNFKGYELSDTQLEMLVRGNEIVLQDIEIDKQKYKKIIIKLNKEKKNNKGFYEYMIMEEELDE